MKPAKQPTKKSPVLSALVVIGALLIVVGLIAGGVYLLYRSGVFQRAFGLEVHPYIRKALPASYQPRVTISVPEQPPGDFKGILFPTAPSPFVLVKTDVWNLGKNERIGHIDYNIGPAAPQALSPDGQYFAYEGNGKVHVHATRSGAKLFEIAYDASLGTLDYLGIGGAATGPQTLLFTPRKGPRATLEVHELPGGTRLHNFDVPRFSARGAVSSPDGKTIAHFSTNELTIYDLATGATLWTWHPPANKYPFLLSPTGIAFSPDGKQLAALCGLSTDNLLLCWDVAGKSLNGEYTVGPMLAIPDTSVLGFQGQPVQWLPDDLGWFVQGHFLVHRPSKRTVWFLTTRSSSLSAGAVLDRDHILAARRTGERDSLVDVPIPWSDINAALQGMTAANAAPVRPGQSVSLQIDLRSLDPDNAGAIADDLEKVLTERLACDGISVAENQPTVLFAEYKEVAGRTLRIYDWGMLKPWQDSGRTANETKMALEVGFRKRGAEEPLWRTYLSHGAGLIVSGQGTTRDVHKDTFDSLKRHLKAQAFPFFIPEDAKGVMLPLVSEL